MIVYCNYESCVWNEDGQCKGPKQPAGHVALYIEETLGGNAVCTDRKEKENERPDKPESGD